MVTLDFKSNTPVKITIAVATATLPIFSFINLYKFIFKRFFEMDDFFESIKYRDFSRHFNEKSGSEDIRVLHKHFNNVNKTILEINAEKEAQHLYLKKILELINTGIIAYNMDSGQVLWVNESFKKTLNIPSLKDVTFVKKRNSQLFETIFEKNHTDEANISVEINKEKTKLLISSTIFQIKEEPFKLIVLQNIDDTLNKNESEAWKKLLSVMTHEIMNSIAPISSLADTLGHKVELNATDPIENPIAIDDLKVGIESIKKRSEGLLKFAKTYRSLNKITTLNTSKIGVDELFHNIKTLMLPSLQNKNMAFLIEIENAGVQIEIDINLIEQVLINLVLNAVEACKAVKHPQITLSAHNSTNGQIIKVKDNGKGISEEVLDQIFIPFFTTKKTGSGIGLSLTKQIMLLHKGKVQVKSKVGVGTSISLIF